MKEEGGGRGQLGWGGKRVILSVRGMEAQLSEPLCQRLDVRNHYRDR